jgi:hypothetical protein
MPVVHPGAVPVRFVRLGYVSMQPHYDLAYHEDQPETLLFGF